MTGDPDQVLSVLTEPDVIARWAPIDFELVGCRHHRLRSGDSVRVRGYLAGRCLEFLVDVAAAGNGCLSLSASGPIQLDVEYVARALDDGSVVTATVVVSGRGLIGRMLAQATDALLAAGALSGAVSRIGRELDERSASRGQRPTPALEPALAA